MNSIATTLVTDFMRPYNACRTEHGYLVAARWLTFTVGTLGTLAGLIFISPEIRSLMEEYFKVIGMFMGALGGLFVLGVISTKANGAGAMIGLFSGVGVMLFVWLLELADGYLFASIGIVTCLLVGYGASTVLRDGDRKSLSGLTLLHDAERNVMAPQSNLGGIIVPLVTPFDEQGELVSEMAVPLITHLQTVGVNGFYVGGSTGEGLLQSIDERRQYLRFVAETTNADVALIAQVGALSFRDAVTLANSARDYGYDAISSTPPFYFRYSEAEIVSYYRELAAQSALPVLLYNVPGTTGRNISLDVQLEMLRLPNVIGSKHTDTDLYVAERLLQSNPDALIFHGADEMLTAGLAMGASGGIGSTFNLMPRQYLDIYRQVEAGDLAKAQATQRVVNDVIRELQRISPSVVPGIKLGLKMLGYDVGRARRPFQKVDVESGRFEKLLRECAES